MVHVQRTSITTPNDFLNDCVIYLCTTDKQRQFIFGVAILRWLFELHVQHTLFKGLSNDDLNQTTVAPTVFESSL